MTNSSRASTTGHIHSNCMQPDIMFEIFEKLPIETIMTCKCVCKEWLRIIEEPFFIEQQRRFSVHQAPRALIRPIYDNPHHLYLVDCESHKARPFHIPRALNPLGKTLFITSTCDGLVCIAEVNREAPVYVYNPILGQLVKLPSNGFEGNISSHLVGIVYHESSRSYKVVRLYKFYVNEQEQYNFRFEMMTLGEGAWTELSPPCLSDESFFWYPLQWRGSIHWMFEPLSKGPRCIMCFDVDSKAFQIVNFIDNPPDPDYTGMELLVLDDNFVFIQSEDNYLELKIWKVECNSVGEYSIGHYSLMETYMPIYCKWIAETERDGIYMLESTRYFSNYSLVELSTNTRTFTELNISGIPSEFITYSFKPTLVSPRRGPNASEDLVADEVKLYKDFEALLISLRL